MGDEAIGRNAGQVPGPDARSETAYTRAATDRGAYRDKIPVEDPAAAPLGTDAESSGVRAQATADGAGSPSDAPARWPEGQRAGPVPSTGASMGAMVGGLVLALVVGAIVLMIAGVI
jgi:hypothetical protein